MRSATFIKALSRCNERTQDAPVFERYNVVREGDLVEAAKKHNPAACCSFA